ncbi:MAG: arginase family protein, partial [Anaerolineae bacterium]|nr:arginase family protein [Anaerolineae bacterium]
MAAHPLSRLQVIAVRYRTTTLAEDDERALDAYAASGVYGAAGVPFDMVEPRMDESRRTADEAYNLGVLNGAIADEVAVARRAGKAILMTGGNCTHVTGVVGGLQDVYGPTARIGLAWFDAHGDFNTPQTTLSGSLGGMPVAVCAGLAFPQWREGSHIVAPLPTDRIVLVDVRNLDPAEAQLIRAVGVPVAAPAPGFPGQDLKRTVDDLAARVDLIYLHVDADILDQAYVPNHGTREPNGPDMAQTLTAIDTVMQTGKVAAFA